MKKGQQMSTQKSILIRTAKVVLPLALMVVAWQAGVLWSQDSKPTPASAEGTQLPKPDPAFKGKIGETFKDSKQDFPQPVQAPQALPMSS